MGVNKSIFSLDEAKRSKQSRGLARILHEYLPKEQPVYDYGCGVGYYLKHLFENGFSGLGFEGTLGIQQIALTDKIVQHDLCQPIAMVLPPGTAISFEVAEHIPPSAERTFLTNVVQHCAVHLIISWAVKGQGGLRHVNEQNASYVIPTVEALGFDFLPNPTSRFRSLAGDDFGWFRKSLYVFRRSAHP